MLFNSYEYFLLLIIVVIIIFFQKKNESKIYLLLFSSYLFYSLWGIFFLLILLLSTAIGYICSWQIYLNKQRGISLVWLLGGVSLYIILLIFFKAIEVPYFTQTNTYLIPIGISFYSFQLISYFIDIYKGQILPEKNLFKFALYISFFPQILAGPIERGAHVLPQLDNINVKLLNCFLGFKMILIGLFKKVLVADKLVLIVNPIYSHYDEFNGLMLLTGTFLFSFQIYCDFSGYTDIALGSAMLIGIKLSNNFNRPYLAASFRGFWHRWHITLSQWFRDYLYISLGGNRKGRIYKWGFIFLVFGVSGLWHGIGWTFLIWSLSHAFFYVFEEILSRSIFFKFKMPKSLKKIGVFAMVTLLWIFFRSTSVNQAVIVFTKILGINNIYFSLNEIALFWEISGLNFYGIFIILFNLLLFIIIDFFKIGNNFIENKMSTRLCSSDLFLINIIVIQLLIFGDWGGERFVYFQF